MCKNPGRHTLEWTLLQVLRYIISGQSLIRQVSKNPSTEFEVVGIGVSITADIVVMLSVRLVREAVWWTELFISETAKRLVAHSFHWHVHKPPLSEEGTRSDSSGILYYPLATQHTLTDQTWSSWHRRRYEGRRRWPAIDRRGSWRVGWRRSWTHYDKKIQTTIEIKTHNQQ